MSSLGPAGTCLLPPWTAGCHRWGLLRGEKQRRGDPPGGFWQLRRRSLGWGREKKGQMLQVCEGAAGSLHAGDKQAGTRAIARDARHGGGTEGAPCPAACGRRGGRRSPAVGGRRQHIWPQRGRGVWGLGGPGSVSGTPGVQACDRGEGVGPEPPRCPGRQARSLSPHPCRKGGQGRVAAEAPTAGPAYAGRVRQVATGASREAGTGRSGAIGTWGGWRPGV